MKKILSLLVFSFSFLASFAQLDNTVEVTGEVKPVATDATKVEVKTQAAQTSVKHYTMQYNVQGQPLSHYVPEGLGNYESQAVAYGKKKGYIRLSGGSHGNLDEQLGYQFDLTDRDALSVDLSLQGFNGKVRNNRYYDIYRWTSRDYRNRSALQYIHHLDHGADLFARGYYENHLFNYMSSGTGTTDKQHDLLAGAEVGLTPYQTGNLSFDLKGGIDFFSQGYRTSLAKKLGETLFHLDGNAGYSFSSEHSIGLGLNFYNSSYGNKELDGITRFRFTPHYTYTAANWNLQLGVFASTKGNVAPDISATYHINPQNSVYLSATGYETDNDFRRLSLLHPHFALDGSETIKMEPEFHQLDLTLGYRFKTPFHLSGDINIGYDISKNAADTDGPYSPFDNRRFPWIDYAKNRRFYINADFIYTYGQLLKLEALNQLNLEQGWTGEKWAAGSLTTPVFSMDWTATLRIVQGLHLGLNWQYATFHLEDSGQTTGAPYKRPDILNLGASLHYTLPIRQPLTLFVQGDNLLHRKFDRYVGYRAPGANFLAGFTLSF